MEERCGRPTKTHGSCMNPTKNGEACHLHKTHETHETSEERSYAKSSRLAVIKKWDHDQAFWDRYRVIGRSIGEGSYSKVYRVIDKKKKSYALKVLIYRKSKNTRDDSLILSTLHHPNIVKYYRKMIIPPGKLKIKSLNNFVPVILTEFIKGKSLKKYSGSNESVISILTGILKALKYINSKMIVHRDIKPDNIMVEGQRGVLIDFGLAYVFENYKETDGGHIGTADYMAPEFEGDHQRTFNFYSKADVFGLGASFYFLLVEKPDWVVERRPIKFSIKRLEKARKELKSMKTPLASLVFKLLNPSPKKRPSPVEALKELD